MTGSFSHTGDGVVAAFASPMSALNAAIDAQGGVAVAGASRRSGCRIRHENEKNASAISLRILQTRM
jgi:hypothetical protein